METKTPLETSERVYVLLPGNQHLEGNIHIPRHSRLIDILNHQADTRPFIALTDVKWTLDGQVTQHEFICLQRSQIVAIYPL
jgi:hypothetical protein